MTFDELRPWQRRDKDVALVNRMVELGLISTTAGKSGTTYSITERGRAAADLGEVHPEPVQTTSKKSAKRSA